MTMTTLVDTTTNGDQPSDDQPSDTELAHAGVKALLRLMGDDPDRPGLRDTPARVVKAYIEMAERPGNPDEFLQRIFDDAEHPVDQMIAVGPIEFASICEHHLLPFRGNGWIAYIPTDGVVGLSKIPRLLEHFARRPQVQERLTSQVGHTLAGAVPNQGVACLLIADHSCASLRGIRKTAPMTTSFLTGRFKHDPAARAEFLALTKP